MTELHAAPIRQSALRAWLRSHAYGLLSSLGRFVRQPFNHLLTLGVLALALALPTLGHLSLKNLKHLSGVLSQPGDVSLFLRQSNVQHGACSFKPLLRRPYICAGFNGRVDDVVA